MRHALYLLVAFTIVLTSCQKKEEVALTRPQAIEALKKMTLPLESDAGIEIENQVILGFKLGMDDSEVHKYVKRLHKNGVMRRMKKSKDTFEYVYDIDLPSGNKLTLVFNANYQNKKLYRISCTPQLKKSDNFDEVWGEMKVVLTDLYGRRSISYKGPDCEGNIWLKGDVMVEQKCWEGDQKIEYSDAAYLTGVETMGN